jgi:hypothetical protein
VILLNAAVVQHGYVHADGRGENGLKRRYEMDWIIRRFKEPSTWRGLIVLAGIAGYSINPELQEKIIAIGTTLLAAIEIIRKEGVHGTPAPVTGNSNTVGDTTTGSTGEQKSVIITRDLSPEELEQTNSGG